MLCNPSSLVPLEWVKGGLESLLSNGYPDECSRHTEGGGRLFSVVDIAASSRLIENKDHPMGPFLYTVSLMHCMPVGLVNGGAGLGMMWGREKAVEMLKQAGFQDVQVLEIPDDPFNLHFLYEK